MKRWWIVIALLLSVGVNVGILATLATRKLASSPPPSADGPAPPPLREEAREEEGGSFPRVHRLADRLGLEGEQRRRFVTSSRASVKRRSASGCTSPGPSARCAGS